ncbi:hypothetical protein [Sphaerospermopsis sp. LEGE 08334]|uniref:hypothetical protein n=1 Tax=Sphaerospermopsis sp. LEGE 08334 TaxID=1828651 RepID=UPI00188057CF|nr:hypothetical protein [Sphaerospermopsis sp. LEGE 08334]MBE9054535.1 hypothetical protein [Sphaerospermopsis sp. LEGE 08334]MBE9054536.1 hypothetical protein [Sphaerospermopsis sp. LEGE 08334]
MQVINNNELFTQVAAEESSVVSGGNAIAGAIALGAILTATNGTLSLAQAIFVQAAALAA